MLLPLAFLIWFFGCSSGPVRTSDVGSARSGAARDGVVVIRPDGTEADQLEAALFCSDAKTLFAYHGVIMKELDEAWQQTRGAGGSGKCSVQIFIDDGGNIVRHQANRCEDHDRLVAALERASPVPAPANPCFRDQIPEVEFELSDTPPAP